jgi:hypothetical protein
MLVGTFSRKRMPNVEFRIEFSENTTNQSADNLIAGRGIRIPSLAGGAILYNSESQYPDSGRKN